MIIRLNKRIEKIVLVLVVLMQASYSIDISEKEYLYKKCNKGDVKACFEFAEFYQSCIYNGACDDSYYLITIQPYQKACTSGIAGACSMLADRYIYGHGVERDVPRGYKFLEKACDMNDSWSCNMRGLFYEIAISTKKLKRALKYYEKACQLSKSVDHCQDRDRLRQLLKKR